jgi:exopolysaccharide biosynthesis polyprenyl glycosylphosphotransferase
MVLFFAMFAQDMYNRSNFQYHDRIVRNVFQACLTASLLCVAMLPFVQEIPYLKRFMGTYILISTIFMTIQWMVTTSVLVHKLRKETPHAILVGDGRNIERYLYFISKTSFAIKPVGYIANDEMGHRLKIPYLGKIEDLDAIIGNMIVDEVIFTLPHTDVEMVERYMQICEERGLTVKISLNFTNMSFSKSCITSVGPLPVITYHTVSLNEVQHMLKRVIDVMGATVGLLITACSAIFIIPAIKLDSSGPVLFKQLRMGRNGRTFTLYKFRSMCSDAEQKKAVLQDQNLMKDGMMFKIINDPRITRVGAFLRKTSMDELPQFLNVLKGDMSLVGTRPPTMDEVMRYEHFQHRRISIKPGITGLWQISGRSDITDFDEVVRLDTLYIDNWSVWKDVSIILRTILMILFKRQHAY